MREKNAERNTEKRTLLTMVRDFLKRKDADLTSLPDTVADDTVRTLVEKGSDGKPRKGQGVKTDGSSGNEPEEGHRESCPYATKRAIVTSLQEIRRFAEEHQLASTVVKALLSLLAEIALDALKGKVTGKVLETLLKALNYDRDKKDAYREGEKAGRNASITITHFPESEAGIPDINGSVRSPSSASSIFDIAKQAKA